MARQASILIASGDAPVKISALAATTASSLQTIGRNRIFVINADQDICILFCISSGSQPIATTSSYRIPANQQTTLDTGQAFDSFTVFNNSTTPVNVYYQTLSVV
jgi:hypothetical protein